MKRQVVYVTILFLATIYVIWVYKHISPSSVDSVVYDREYSKSALFELEIFYSPLSRHNIKTADGNIKKIDNKTTTKEYQGKLLENTLCITENKKNIEIPKEWIDRCPDKPVVTAPQSGRLGNQLWEYASVWAAAKYTNREPFVPVCLINRLKTIFKNFTKVLPFKYIEKCPINYRHLVKKEDMQIEDERGSILLPKYVQLPEYIVPHLKEVL